MLMRQKCLLSYISCRLGFAFQIIFILNRWSLILIWTCLLFSVKLFNTNVLTIRKTLDNSLGLQDDMRFLVSTTRPRGHACKSTCKSIQQKYKAKLCGATYYFFCMAWKCRCKFFFSWNDTILRPRSDPETYGCRSWIWGVCMKQMLYAKFRSDRLKRDLPFSANGNDWIRLNFLQNNRLFVCLYFVSFLFSKALESPYGDCL